MTAKGILAKMPHPTNIFQVNMALHALLRRKAVDVVNPSTIAEIDARLAETAKRIETLGADDRPMRVRHEMIYAAVNQEAK